jgi:hypothetical protein
MAWHRSYICSGIRHCVQSDPRIIHPSPQYDRVDPKILNELYTKAGRPPPPEEDENQWVRDQTLQYDIFFSYA